MPDRAPTTAVLLAAGAGSRLDPSPESLPKCLWEVAGQTILDRMVRALAAHGFRRLVVVAGYRQHLLRAALSGRPGSLEVEFLVNEAYATTENIVSLLLAREHVDEPFLLLESDLLFDPALLAGMLAPDRIAVSELADWMNGTRVLAGAGPRIEKFLFPPHTGSGKQLKTVNIYSLSRGSWERVSGVLERYVSEGRNDVFYEHAFAELVEEGWIAFDMVPFPQSRWYEVDTRADLDEAERLVATSWV